MLLPVCLKESRSRSLRTWSDSATRGLCLLKSAPDIVRWRLEALMRKGRCRGCGADILWIKTAAGKNMPCDPEPVTYWARKGAAGKVMTPNGEVISCDFTGDLKKATGIGYVSHFSTCPSAGKFRRA